MTTRARPRINTSLFTRALTDRLPAAVVTPGRDGTVAVEGSEGSYTVTLTIEDCDEWQTITVAVALTQPPGFDAPLDEAIPVPDGMYSLTSDFGQPLRHVDHSALATSTVQVIETFEAASPSLSAGATT